MDNPKPTFNQKQVINRYEEFVSSFMSDEKNVKRTELLLRFWTVTVPEKHFSVSITCECIGNFHGIEQWFAIVEEENGGKITSYYLKRSSKNGLNVKEKEEELNKSQNVK